MQLKALKRRSRYKSDSAYLDAVYRNNKEAIDSNIDPNWVKLHKTPKAAFKALVREKMLEKDYTTGKNYKINKAIKKLANSKDLNKEWTNKDVMYNNFQQLIKKEKGLSKEFRKRLRDERGRFRKYSPKDLKFLGYYTGTNGNAAVYQIGDLIIMEKKSPDKNTGASVSYMNETDFKYAEGKTIFFSGYSAKEAKTYRYSS